jgi:hypothetical protein
MKDLYQVLEQKKTEIERLRREIEALHFVIPLLAENADWVENGLALPGSHSRETPIATAKRVAPEGTPAAKNLRR